MTDKATDQFTRIVVHLEGKHGPIVAQGVGHELRSRFQGGPEVLHERRELVFRDGARAVLLRAPAGPWSLSE